MAQTNRIGYIDALRGLTMILVVFSHIYIPNDTPLNMFLVNLRMPMFFFILKLPYTIPASILTLPMVAVVKFLFTKIKDHAFRNSIRFLINLVLWPILMIIYAAVAYSLLPWEWALPITLALLPAPIVAQETWRMLRLFKSDIKLHNNKNLRDKYKKIRTLFLQNR